MLTLTAYKESTPALLFPLWRHVHTIGRGRGADFSLPDTQLAPIQLLLVKRPNNTYEAVDQTGKGFIIDGHTYMRKLLTPNHERISLPGQLSIGLQAIESPAVHTTSPMRYSPNNTESIGVIAIDNKKDIQITDSCSIGTDPKNHIQLHDGFASSFHCLIYKTENKFFIKDLGSTNHTLVDNRIVIEAQLPDRATITLGNTTLQFEILEDQIQPSFGFSHMIGQSPSMQKLFKQIKKVAESQATVFILGESGTGKELVAQAIHNYPTPPDGPFYAINCAGLPRELVESELFGHVKGAFTGAASNYSGAFRAAHNGSLFLDEIGDLPFDVQPKLLRVLEDGKVKPIGSSQYHNTNVRLIAATNKDLQEAVHERQFREDLFYRLMVYPIQIPPLRERGNDILLLAQHFLSLHSPVHTKLRLTDDAKNKLLEHAWPGNVRELGHTMQRSIFQSQKETIDAQDIALLKPMVKNNARIKISSSTVKHEPKGFGTADQRQTIVRALIIFHGNKVDTATFLGISRATLYRLIQKYAILPDEYKT